MKTTINQDLCKWKEHIDDLIEQTPGLEEEIMQCKDQTMLMACYVCDGYNQECGSYETRRE